MSVIKQFAQQKSQTETLLLQTKTKQKKKKIYIWSKKLLSVIVADWSRYLDDNHYQRWGPKNNQKQSKYQSKIGNYTTKNNDDDNQIQSSK